MADSVYKICPNCGKANLNWDYCEYCGAIINVYLKRRQERKLLEEQKKRLKKEQGKNSITTFFENAREHPNGIIRFFAKFFYSIWVIVIAIGSFLAFLIGYVAA